MANKKGYRDLMMSTEGISLNIVENATSGKLSNGDLRKAWGRLKKRWNPKTREDKVEVYTLQAGEYKTETNGLVGILRKETNRISKYWA